MKQKRMDKRYILWSVLVLMTGVLASCSSSGSKEILNDEEKILVGCDTFPLRSNLREGENIYTTPDSFLLGECLTLFGSLHTDVLTQFVCPEGFHYPEGAEVDSVCLFVYYSSWHGDGLTPLSLNVYEMDGEVLEYTGVYSCAERLSRFCSKKICVAKEPRIVVAAHPTDSVQNSSTGKYIPYVTFRLTDEFRDRFFAIKDFSDQNRFNEVFKGLYITSEFGGGTILHVPEISMAVYYHYEYQQLYDTTKYLETDIKGFYANTEVRQINRYELIDPQIEILALTLDEVDYVLSPGFIFTELKIPMQHMTDSILAAIGEKRAYINQALIEVEVLNVEEEEDEEDKARQSHWAEPSEYMLLIKESALERFFSSHELPSDSCALLQSLSMSVDSLEETHYFYSYDLSTLLTYQLREKDPSLIPDTLKMVLVPVDVKKGTLSSSSSTTTITDVKHKQTISATAIRSANIENNPMRLEVVYSGF